jgi:hypothetical protein
MIFLWDNTHALEDEEESEDGDVSDAILDELDGDDIDDELMEGDAPPLIPLPDEDIDEDESEDETARAFFDDEDGDGDGEDEGDYDSFDDKDEL